ncbi:unnamed protein product [Bursaphelenchus xylophilus]|uniref:(pine wood nematode) hypothetical protein n=1 Tax=Bursaphelenchus xylophilus TaxID=6326 RepID=A0A1I7SCC9_BURXY|nr:unnamed protein product [Bursaphelenchus xylophilus]CAG9094333.1 unnamed protein product [Bursaphelenchus xylophilus]
MADYFEELRFGGPCGDDEPEVASGGDDEAKKKAEERERKKAEVRKRLEEAGSKKKAKKGFLTPERKKKLRKLLMIKAAEDLKQQQLKREQERNQVLQKRIIPLPDVDSIDDKGKLESIYNELFSRMVQLEEEKYDINALVSEKDAQINELTIAVNDLRGKFVKPALKKVSKYDNKFKKAIAAEGGATTEKADFRSQLKVVKKENALDVLSKKQQQKSEKPEWSKKGGAKVGEAPPTPVKTEGKAEDKPAEEEVVEEEEGEEEEEE